MADSEANEAQFSQEFVVSLVLKRNDLRSHSEVAGTRATGSKVEPRVIKKGP